MGINAPSPRQQAYLPCPKCGHLLGGAWYCGVRAVALALGLSIDDAFDLLFEVQGKYRATGFFVAGFIAVEPKIFGAKRVHFRGTLRQFCSEHHTGTFIVFIAKHCFTVIDGLVCDADIVACDTVVYADRRVKQAFAIDRSAASLEVAA